MVHKQYQNEEYLYYLHSFVKDIDIILTRMKENIKRLRKKKDIFDKFLKSCSRNNPSTLQVKRLAEPSDGVFNTNFKPEMGSEAINSSATTRPERISNKRTWPSEQPQKTPFPVGIYSTQLTWEEVEPITVSSKQLWVAKSQKRSEEFFEITDEQ